ncbi:hypothetical protein HGI30_22770 [Paenibacillus albicereus]|uniref:VCBS repeat-containing protein n=1 Tax=Paenibacillus albicereus TaxID=2726185 RepID=A0A6H2H3R4_9BACL|nr:hypothetical protein [Paenibacillus albicereus]QJC54066.1 hypothetical protein HGI30_22770 [Paenibacillus albicereus]
MLRRIEHGQVASFMQLDASSYERDWDGDGKEEAIVATRKQNQIYVFKEQDGRLLWTSIRDALQAGPNDALQYDDGLGVFRFLSAGGVVETYRLQGEPESLVRVSGNSGL